MQQYFVWPAFQNITYLNNINWNEPLNVFHRIFHLPGRNGFYRDTKTRLHHLQVKNVNSSLSSQFELRAGPHRNCSRDEISSVATIPQIELVSVDSDGLLKVITPHFHFDSNTYKKRHSFCNWALLGEIHF